MPVRSYDTRADFLRDYSSPYWLVEDPPGSGQIVRQAFVGVEAEYGIRQFGLRIGESNADLLIVVLNPNPADTLLILGSGFGWTVEVLEARGFASILGIDTSPYIQTAKDLDDGTDIDAALIAGGLNPLLSDGARIKAASHSPGPRVRASRGIPNEDLGTGASRGRVKQFLGVSGADKIVLGVSEFALDALTDAEAVSVSDRMNDVCDRVVHAVTLPTRTADADWNLKTLAGWKALIPGDEFLDSDGGLL